MASAANHRDPGADRARTDPDLRVALENHLPTSLPAGCATAIFCFGHCFHRHRGIARLELLVGANAHRPAAVRMPRRDLYDWLHASGEDPEGRSYRSGFWATLPVRAPRAPGAVQVSAAVELDGGARCVAPLGKIEITAAEPGDSRSDLIAGRSDLAPQAVAICMATYEPDPALLRAQLESLRAQSDESWTCLISDGGSSPKAFAQLLDSVGEDRRFVVSRSERRLAPYRNFERALEMVPPLVELVALCDQDDRWHPDKLARLREAIGTANLVYSDQRLVSEEGRVLRESLWQGRRNDYRNLASMLVANAVPGAAMVFRRELLELALPFPDPPGIPYHDHWLALVALASGELRYVDEPLFDWVQHPGAVSGAAVPARSSLGSRGWRAAYFGGFVPREVQARTLLLRCGALLTTHKRRALERFVASGRSPVALAWLALRPLRRLAGRDETLGGEFPLARGVAWRWLIAFAAGRSQRPGRRTCDASFPDPPRFEQRRLRRWRAGS